jgi:hypothetical protein
MKKVLLTMMAALLIVSVPASAQQRKTVKKATTTAKRTTPRKKAVSQPVTIQMDEPCIAGGAIAFNGIPITLSDKEMASELTGQGFKFKKDEFGNGQWTGKAFGVEGNVTVMKNPARVTFTEKKFYNKTQVRKRVMAYKDAFEELSGCTAKENTMGWNRDEGGTVKIPINSGYIEISYANCDEVDFSSKDYMLMIVYSE